MTETLASRVERVRQLSIQAIEGPWHVVHNSWDTSTIYGAENNCVAQCLIDEKCTEENQEEFELSKDCSAEFIAHAPAMASLVSELWEIVQTVTKERDAALGRNPDGTLIPPKPFSQGN